MPLILNGSTGISGTDGSASTPAVQGTDTNTGLFFPAADTIAFAEGGTEVMRIDASGRVLIGATTARANFLNSTTSANFQVEGTGTDGSNAALIRNSDNANPPRFLFGKSRGSTIGSNVVVQSGDILGSFVFQGNDGAEFVDGAAISAVVDAAPGTDNMPTRLTFSTATTGGSPVERMRIDNAGNVGIGTSAPTQRLSVDGNATFTGTAVMASSFLRNRLINGGFDVWQRGTSTSTSSAYLADRWIIAAGTSITATQSSDVPSGFRFSLSLAGTAFPQTIQRIESINCFDLVGQSVTVSFWAKQTVGAGSNSLAVQLYSANAVDNFGATTVIGTQLLNGSTSWTRYTATFSSLPAAAANGLQVLIYANTAGSATFLVTGVQLEVGTVATPFERRQFGTELMLCQRYFETGAARWRGQDAGGATLVWSNDFKVTKRTTPTMTGTSSPGASLLSDSAFSLQAAGSGTVDTGIVAWTASAEL